jgi:hypothetical protein
MTQHRQRAGSRQVRVGVATHVLLRAPAARRRQRPTAHPATVLLPMQMWRLSSRR